MAEYDDTNRGVLFVNDKGDNEKRPDYRGTLNVEGTEYELSGWKRTSAKGTKFLSLSVREKTVVQTSGGYAEARLATSEHEASRQLYGKSGKPDHARAAAYDGFEDQDVPF